MKQIFEERKYVKFLNILFTNIRNVIANPIGFNKILANVIKLIEQLKVRNVIKYRTSTKLKCPE